MIHSVLTEYGVPFYDQLPYDDKVTFQKRVRDFLKGRQLRPRDMEDLSLEHQVLVSASAVTVTFGVKKFYFPYFNLVMVYPQGYEQLIKKRYQTDRVKMQGAVVLGLDELIAGTRDPATRFHPGIHEFSHALYHENVIEMEGYFNISTSEVRDQMQQHAMDIAAMDYLPPLMREMTPKYPQQFFASVATLYFTQPEAVTDRWPALSGWLANIFQQKISTS